jgi:hypothetical protein
MLPLLLLLLLPTLTLLHTSASLKGKQLARNEEKRRRRRRSSSRRERERESDNNWARWSSSHLIKHVVAFDSGFDIIPEEMPCSAIVFSPLDRPHLKRRWAAVQRIHSGTNIAVRVRPSCPVAEFCFWGPDGTGLPNGPINASLTSS